jgi:uncharacterized protein YndB with AHSA1/START domain
MKWVLTIVGVVAAVIAVIAATGFALPQSHVASRSAELSAPPEKIWALVTDPSRYPSWRKEVTRVEHQGGSPLRWVEFSGDERISYEADVSEAPSHFVARIADPDLPFGGRWDYRIEPSRVGSRITITEYGEVYNPIFRFVSRFVMGHTATIDKYLTALAATTGDSYNPERRK